MASRARTPLRLVFFPASTRQLIYQHPCSRHHEEGRKSARCRFQAFPPLEKYAGPYNDASYGPITIRMENGGLVITFDHTPTMMGDLQQTRGEEMNDRVQWGLPDEGKH